MRTRIKVCGITSAVDAAAAVEAGADAVGVILAPSPRQLTLEEAAQVLAVVPPLVWRVGVFVDPSPDELTEAAERLDLDLVQLSGDEPPSLCIESPLPVLKTIQVGTPFDSEVLEPYRGLVAAFLLDTHVTGIRGGTGKPFDWLSIRGLPAWAPIFVAGGLHPGNVADAIRALHPFAVDVSSGVEERPRVKDHDKLRGFCTAVRAADSEVPV